MAAERENTAVHYMPDPNRWFGWWASRFRGAAIEDVKRDGHPSVVYFLSAPSVGRVKIGTSARLTARIAEIGYWCPVDIEVIGTVMGGLSLERVMHEAFRPFRVRGEWFERSDQSAPLFDSVISAAAVFAVHAISGLREMHPDPATLAALLDGVDPSEIDAAADTLFAMSTALRASEG